MNKMITNKNYIAISDWMLDYKLNVRELLVFAIIYGFTQDDKEFYGSFDYIAEWLGVKHSNNITRYLKPLVEKKLINKKVVYDNRSKKCIYKSAINHGPVINNSEYDYIIIQPWMIASSGLNLNGKDLLLYALIHSYSRKGSGNYCRYNLKYFTKWLGCRQDHVNRQINKAIAKGLIQNNNGRYVAIVPKEIKEEHIPQSDSCSFKTDIKLTQTDSMSTKTDSQYSPKLIANNTKINNLSNNLFINNSEVVSDKQLSDFIYTNICTSEIWKVSLYDKEACSYANKALSKIDEIAKTLKQNDKKLFVCLDSDSIIEIYMKALNAVEDIYNSFTNPSGYIRKIINMKLYDLKNTT